MSGGEIVPSGDGEFLDVNDFVVGVTPLTELLRFVLLGLGVGAVYALTAQGLVLIYRGSGVVNFAQGAFAMIGAFLYYRGTSDHGLVAGRWPGSSPSACPPCSAS